MAQLTIYLPDDVEREVRAGARRAGKSVSAYLAELASKRKGGGKGWPKGFRKLFGSWEGELEEPADPAAQEREEL